MNISNLIYLIDLSSSIVVLCVFLSSLCFIISIIFFGRAWTELDELGCDNSQRMSTHQMFNKVSKKFLVMGILLSCVAIILPSSRTGYMMLSSSIATSIFEKTNLSEKLLKVIEHQLEKYATE